MHCARTNQWTGALWLILVALAANAGGCHNGPCNDITPGAIPQPNGTYSCQWIHAQAARADQDNFVIYQYEWAADGMKLTQFGQEHMAGMAQRLPQVPYPVVIEPSSDQHVNESRRLAVLDLLANYHAPISPDRVILGRSEAEGLYGQEAPGHVRGMFSNNSSGGQGAGSMGGVGTGSTLGGTSTSGGASPGIGVGVGVF